MTRPTLPLLFFWMLSMGAAEAAALDRDIPSIHGTISVPANIVAVKSRELPGENVTLNPQPLPPKILVLGGEATIQTQSLAKLSPQTACADLVVSAHLADGSVRSTHAGGDSLGGRCTYDLPIHGPGPVTEITVTSAASGTTHVRVPGSSLGRALQNGGTVNFTSR